MIRSPSEYLYFNYGYVFKAQTERIIKYILFLSTINNTMMCRFQKSNKKREKKNSDDINSGDIKTQDIMSGHTTMYFMSRILQQRCNVHLHQLSLIKAIT